MAATRGVAGVWWWLRRLPSRHDRWLVLLATVFFYTFFIPYFDLVPETKANLDNPNENARVWNVRSIVEFGEIHINSVMRQWHTRSVDLARGADNRLFPAKSPGVVLFVVPFYWVYYHTLDFLGIQQSKFMAVYSCRLAGVIVPSIVLSFVIYLLLRRICRGDPYVAHVSYFAYVLGSLAYPYTLILTSHQLASAGLFVAFITFAAGGRHGYRRSWPFLVAGLLMGIAVSAEYSAVVPAFFVGLYGVIRGTHPQSGAFGGSSLKGLLWARRHLLLVLAGAALPVGAMLLYHKLAFGSVLSTPYKHMVTEAFRQKISQSYGFTSPTTEAVVGLLFSPASGLFFYSPFLLLSGLGAYYGLKDRHLRLETLTLLAMATSIILFIMCRTTWRGGWTVGPRYIANAVPPMVALTAYGLTRLRMRHRELGKVLLVGLSLVAISLTAPSAALFPHLPENMNNPFYEAVVPLLRLELAPMNIMGIPAREALVVFGVAVGLVCGYALVGGGGRTPADIAKTAVIPLLLLVLFHLVFGEHYPIDYGRVAWFEEFACRLFPDRSLACCVDQALSAAWSTLR